MSARAGDQFSPGGISSGKKIAKVEALHVDDGLGAGMNSDPYEEDDDRPIMERPIRPKARVDYNDIDPTIETEAAAPAVPTESFPPGQHPLEDVPNFQDLPTPEQLTIKSKEFCEQNKLLQLLGEYRARCLFCKQWTVREAVITKIQQLLRTEFTGDVNQYILPITGVIKIAADDKIQQVLFNGITLMEQFLQQLKR
jgi:hypothetical protein